MKLYYSPFSPYVRKVLACAAVLKLTIEKLPSAAGPVARDPAIIADNPLGQVPTFITDDGMALYDSRVICEYLDAQPGGGSLFPAPGPARWRVLVEQSLGDGVLAAALLSRYEAVLRPAEKQWPDWVAGQMDKIRTALDKAEEWAPTLGERLDIGTITIGCALGYLDLRFPDVAWRKTRPQLASWFERFDALDPMTATRHPA